MIILLRVRSYICGVVDALKLTRALLEESVSQQITEFLLLSASVLGRWSQYIWNSREEISGEVYLTPPLLLPS